MPRQGVLPVAAALLLLIVTSALAADWPMWRHDAQRSGVSPQALPAQLHLQWMREFPPQPRAWLEPINQDRMPYDRCYEPIVLGTALIFGSAYDDAVIALDTRTGVPKWRLPLEGPVRLAPAGWNGKVYVVCDDGYLYCISVAEGRVMWRARGGPSEQKVLGNGRLISMWPARGGPVVADGVVYFAAGIWPSMGIFMYALDAETGKVVWANSGSAPRFMMQIKRGPAFDGVAPQGPLVVAGDRLLVPCGRSVPACFDRRTGRFLYYHTEGYVSGGRTVFDPDKRHFVLESEDGQQKWWYKHPYRRLRYVGGSEVYAWGDYFFNGGMVFDVVTGGDTMPFPRRMVLDEKAIFALPKDRLVAYDLQTLGPKTPQDLQSLRGKRAKIPEWKITTLWQQDLPNSKTIMKAGSRLYVGRPGEVIAFELPDRKEPPRPIWKGALEGDVCRLIAADDRLFAVTAQGSIYCFGAEKAEPRMHRRERVEWEPPAPGKWAGEAQAILKTTGVRGGYCFAFGLDTGALIRDLAVNSKLRIVAFDPDVKKVAAVRRNLELEDLYGRRVAVHRGDPMSLKLPPYLASLIVSEDPEAAGIGRGDAFAAKVFAALRPYGGVACFPLPAGRQAAFEKAVAAARLPKAKLVKEAGFVSLYRDGPLPGAADWTHQYCDAAKTNLAMDDPVKLPLGLLWFGGSSHEAVLPRHGCGPVPQVLDGRLFHEGPNGMRATDVYTGRVLWEASLPGLGLAYDTVVHQPHARLSGGNYASIRDGIYVSYGQVIVRLDPATGRKLAEFKLPQSEEDTGDATTHQWGPVTVFGDLLLAGVIGHSSRKSIGGHRKPIYYSSEELVALNRHTGKALWRLGKTFGHLATAVGGGKVFCVGGPSQKEVDAAKRRGDQPKTRSALFALDAKTGDVRWESEKHAGTWLSYSEPRDLLIVAGARGIGAAALKGADGSPVWQRPGSLGAPLLIRGDTFFTQNWPGPRAYSLLTGEPVTRKNPLTGEAMPWGFTRSGDTGCSEVIGGLNLLTYRACSAGYFDLICGGMGNVGGFRSSCTSNLIPANGVLNCPDYTRTCMCMYANQCSLALVHMPDVEMWVESPFALGKQPITRLGINLGAPGDRTSSSGTLWIEYPVVGGRSPQVTIATGPDRPATFRRHSSEVQGALSWVGASGLQGVRSVTIALNAGEKAAERSYTVRLCFAEPEDIGPGRRVFDVALQGRPALSKLDICREAGGANRVLIRTVKGVRATGELKLNLAPAKGETILCGIEMLEEK